MKRDSLSFLPSFLCVLSFSFSSSSFQWSEQELFVLSRWTAEVLGFVSSSVALCPCLAGGGGSVCPAQILSTATCRYTCLFSECPEEMPTLLCHVCFLLSSPGHFAPRQELFSAVLLRPLPSRRVPAHTPPPTQAGTAVRASLLSWVHLRCLPLPQRAPSARGGPLSKVALPCLSLSFSPWTERDMPRQASCGGWRLLCGARVD